LEYLKELCEVPIGFVALVIIVIVIATMPGKRSATMTCRWLRDWHRNRQAAMDRWFCSQCSADAFTSNGRPPAQCMRSV
jgi:hypothetical protein